MFPVHLLPPKGKAPRPQEGDEGRPHLVPFTHDEVAPAHHEAAGAHVHMAPWLQQADVFLWERRNGSLDSGQCSHVICRHPGSAKFLVAPLAAVLRQILLLQLGG